MQNSQERVAELEYKLYPIEAEKDELEVRLAEIASIAAPDESERLERIEQKLDALLAALPKLNDVP